MDALDKIQIEVDKQMFLEQERIAAEEARIKEEGDKRRKMMLQKLKEQAEAADQVSTQKFKLNTRSLTHLLFLEN